MRQILILAFGILLSCAACKNLSDDRRPNIVIIFLDDSGWSDFQPFGEDHIETPGMAELASEGCMFTRFYVPQAICSASRAALLTGCYPGRTKVFGAHAPRDPGLDPGFATLGEVFRDAGYRTALFGKWHCGDQEGRRPHERGFDESCGLMYSNDMWKHHPENPDYWGKYPLDFWENGRIIRENLDSNDQRYLTRWYTEHAVDFINRNADSAFLLYVPHSMPHVPIFCSPEFEGRSGAGLYADVIMELDWSVSRINNTLKENGIENNTIVIFTSDNGPWSSYGNHSGYTPFREAKATSFDGGVRSACIIKYPPALEPGSRNSRTLFTIDLLPTLCYLSGIPLPANEIDGKNMWDVITHPETAESPHKYYAVSTDRNLDAIISGDGKWKLHLPHHYRTLLYPGNDGMPGKYEQAEIGLSLYDMENDPLETLNHADKNPDVVSALLEYAQGHREKFYPINPAGE